MKKLYIDNVKVLRELCEEHKGKNLLLGFDEYTDNLTVYFNDSVSRKLFSKLCQQIYPV